MTARASGSQLLGGGDGQAVPSRARIGFGNPGNRVPKRRSHGPNRLNALKSHQERVGQALLERAILQRRGYLGNAPRKRGMTFRTESFCFEGREDEIRKEPNSQNAKRR